jgi:Flp pilus assembly pilin Flp
MTAANHPRNDHGHGMIEFGILVGTLALGVVLMLLAIGTQLSPATPDNTQHRIGEP